MATRRKPVFSLIASVVALLGLGCVLTFCVIGFNLFEFRRTLREFPERHLEVTDAINGVYRYYRTHGKWPEANDLAADGVRPIPADWEYMINSFGPVLRIFGPYHISMLYRFADPAGGAPHTTWEISVEGDSREFPASVSYDDSGASDENQGN